MECLCTKIDDLGYSTIEHEIVRYYDLGSVNSSGLPITLSDDEYGTYYINGTRKHGDFSIRITKQPDGKYSLFVVAYNLKKHKNR
ncbi:hypothetical protein [Ruminiclostridium cellulolyticum]|uniref:Uncharacterized protein n=1 Tax=Ruminiclostridium cellulolyticum (strain ATCC 35319 / DSM 5812 / JCM 6584 / H10) TaxID=394503 RepID=B8I8U2_RUMCH|nr:hypothetical protein [Ruminiclostridium cellulolyticum]ACL77274.1 hypothetical protein Ccel_2980 [Ruminiclostridium cellulolyticum H10]